MLNNKALSMLIFLTFLNSEVNKVWLFGMFYNVQRVIHLVCTQIFRKTSISYPLVRTQTFVYQRVKNVTFLKKFV